MAQIPKKKPKSSDLVRGREARKAASANVSTLKTHLGRFLKMVRDGQDVVILDRQTPIAKIVGFSGESKIQISENETTWDEAVESISKEKKPRLKKSVLDYLADDRGDK